jgi:hypothetical protein
MTPNATPAGPPAFTPLVKIGSEEAHNALTDWDAPDAMEWEVFRDAAGDKLPN